MPRHIPRVSTLVVHDIVCRHIRSVYSLRIPVFWKRLHGPGQTMQGRADRWLISGEVGLFTAVRSVDQKVPVSVRT